MLEPEKEVEMEEHFNENLIYDNLDFDASLVCYSPSRMYPSPEACSIYYSPSLMVPSPEASLFYYSPSRVPPSPEPEISLWNFSDRNASSSTLPLVRSPSPILPKRDNDLRISSRIMWVIDASFTFVLVKELKRPQNEQYLFRQQLKVQEFDIFTSHWQVTLTSLGQWQQLKALVHALNLGLLQKVEEFYRLDQELDRFPNEKKENLFLKKLGRLTSLQVFILLSVRQLQLELFNSSLEEAFQGSFREQLKELVNFSPRQQLKELVSSSLRQPLKELLNSLLRQQLELVLVQEMDRLQNKNRKLHKFLQHASQVKLQMKIKCTPMIDDISPEICEEGHDNASIEILDKMTMVADTYNIRFSWTKAPCRHRSRANGGDLKKGCTSFDGCYMHQDCMSTVKLEIYGEYHIERLQYLAFSSHIPFFFSEYSLVHYPHKIELQSDHASCELIASADYEPDSTCELDYISHSTRSPPGPDSLPDEEEMLQQDLLKHQLVGESHAMKGGENVLSEGRIHTVVSYPENEGTRKTPKRKANLEDLQHFSGSREDAAKHFRVSVSTIKRCLRDHDIDDWRNRKIDENNQCLSEPQDITESFQGEGAEMGNQMAGGSRSHERKLNHEQIGFPQASVKGADRSQMEESSTKLETTPMGNMFASSTHEQCIEVRDHSELHVQPSELNISAARLRPDVVNSTLPPIPEGNLLIENSRSSRELSDDYISATEAFNAEQTNLSCSDRPPKLANTTAPHLMPLVTETQGTKTVTTMKATYREDMIRFQLPLTVGIIELRKEVAEGLMLEVGTFSIKYLDDDEDWILMNSDKALQECFNISVSLGRKVIKLSIHDITPS